MKTVESRGFEYPRAPDSRSPQRYRRACIALDFLSVRVPGNASRSGVERCLSGGCTDGPRFNRAIAGVAIVRKSETRGGAPKAAAGRLLFSFHFSAPVSAVVPRARFPEHAHASLFPERESERRQRVSYAYQLSLTGSASSASGLHSLPVRFSVRVNYCLACKSTLLSYDKITHFSD